MLLPIDQFFPELTNLYRSTQSSGTVWLTYKQHTLKDGKRIVLVRATDGRKKISLHLQPNEVKYFQDRYTAVLKHNVHKLKKRPAADAAAPAKRAATSAAKQTSAKKSSSASHATSSTAASSTATSSSSKKS